MKNKIINRLLSLGMFDEAEYLRNNKVSKEKLQEYADYCGI